MILEMAVLPIKFGRAQAFEEAFEHAKPLVAATPGFINLELRRCLENSDRYLLLIHWESVAAHQVEFRLGPNYEEWKALLHDFYDPFPTVEHYEVVTTQ